METTIDWSAEERFHPATLRGAQAQSWALIINKILVQATHGDTEAQRTLSWELPSGLPLLRWLREALVPALQSRGPLAEMGDWMPDDVLADLTREIPDMPEESRAHERAFRVERLVRKLDPNDVTNLMDLTRPHLVIPANKSGHGYPSLDLDNIVDPTHSWLAKTWNNPFSPRERYRLVAGEGDPPRPGV